MIDQNIRLQHLSVFLPEVARVAGEIHLAHWGKVAGGDIAFKGRRDLVTAADRESEAALVSHIRREFPEDAVFAEESGPEAGFDAADLDRAVWFIDPVDGTTNFAHGHPFFAVSIGVWLGGQPLAGCVHAARLGETFLALRGQGATLNGRRIHTTETSGIRNALLATGFAYKIEELEQNNIDNFSRLVTQARGIRRCGAASLDFAYTACGRYDGFWELHLEPWDIAAGALLVQEAGGRVSEISGGDKWLFGRNIVASNGPLHEELLHELRAFP